MKKRVRALLPFLLGAAYGLLLILLTFWLITGAADVVAFAAQMLRLEAAQDVILALRQLEEARIQLPWAVVLLLGALALFLAWLLRRCRRKALVSSCLAVVLVLPLTVMVLAFTTINGIRPANALLATGQGREYPAQTYASSGETWYFGFGSRQILLPKNSDQPLYIAGYRNGVEISGVLDICQARAAWLEAGGEGVLLIGVDCVALDSGTVETIRRRLADVPNCSAIHVYATHTHAGIDTLGLWGPVGINGKNEDYMEALLCAAEEAAREAAGGRKAGTLSFSQAAAGDLCHDSRRPLVFDENIYQLSFAAADGSSGLRMLLFGAHAESLRGANTLLSRDFPGRLCDAVTRATGDDAMFFPGAVGGLIMTKELTDVSRYAEANMSVTASRLTDRILAIEEDQQQVLSPRLVWSNQRFTIPLDNPVFLLYKLLGILGTRSVPGNSAMGYLVDTELTVLMLDDVALVLLPGEIFPELVLGGSYGSASAQQENPEPLAQIAASFGVQRLIVVGLADDEVGYIVPPSDFLVNPQRPYFDKVVDSTGENHYEETNSVGPLCAVRVAQAFTAALRALPE